MNWTEKVAAAPGMNLFLAHEKASTTSMLAFLEMIPGTEVVETTPVHSQSSAMSTCRTVDPETALAGKH